MRETEAVCDRALELRPPLGEFRGDGFATWLAVALPATISAVAGFESEKLWNDCRASKAGSILDYRGAWLRAATLVYDPQSIPHLLSYARAEARYLLKRYWRCVESVAAELQKHGTLNSEQIDAAISHGCQLDEAERERDRRRAEAQRAERAKRFVESR